MHRGRESAAIVTACAVASLALADLSVRGYGPVALPSPVSALLLLPAVAGTGAALAAVDPSRLALADPPAARLLRATASSMMAVAGCVAASAGLLRAAVVPAPAVVRNVLVFYGLGLLLSRTDGGMLWTAPVGYLFASVLFGVRESGDIAVWAFVLDQSVGGWQMLIVGAVIVIGIANLTRPPAHRLRPAQHST